MSTLNIIGWSILLITWISMIYLAVGQYSVTPKTRRIWVKINLALSAAALGVFVANIITNIL
jgi:hypothetical protein